MKSKFKKIIPFIFAFNFFIVSTLIIFHPEKLYASENVEAALLKKVSKSYTNKFCNSVGFGLSKESARNFSLKENNQVFKKRKEYDNINKELLAEEIALEVVEKCGYPINLSGQKGVEEFKSYYLSKDKESKEIN